MALDLDSPAELHISDAEYARLGKTCAFVANFLVGRLRARGGSEHPAQLAESFKHCYNATPKKFMGLGNAQNYLAHLSARGCSKYLRYDPQQVQLVETAETLPDAGPSRGSLGDRTRNNTQHASRWCESDEALWAAPEQAAAAPPALSAPPTSSQSALSSSARSITSTEEATYALTPQERARLERLGAGVALVVSFVVAHLSKQPARSADWSVLGTAFSLSHGQSLREALRIGAKQNILAWLQRAGCTYLFEDSGLVTLLQDAEYIQPAGPGQPPQSSSGPPVGQQQHAAHDMFSQGGSRDEGPPAAVAVRTPAQLQDMLHSWRALTKGQTWPVQLLLPLLQGSTHLRTVSWLLCALAPEATAPAQVAAGGGGHFFALDVHALSDSHGGRMLLRELLLEQPALRIGYAPLSVQPQRRQRTAEWLWPIVAPPHSHSSSSSSSSSGAASAAEQLQPVCCWDMSDHRSTAASASGAHCFDDCSAVLQHLAAAGHCVDATRPAGAFDAWCAQFQPHNSALDATAAGVLLQRAYDGIVRDGSQQMRSGTLSLRMLQQAAGIPGLVFAGSASAPHGADGASGVSESLRAAQAVAMAAAYHSWEAREATQAHLHSPHAASPSSTDGDAADAPLSGISCAAAGTGSAGWPPAARGGLY